MQTSYGYAFFALEVTNALITFDHHVIGVALSQPARSNTRDACPTDEAHRKRTLPEKGAII
jgi:hypothetical protein